MKKKLKGVADFFRSEEPKGKQKETRTEEPRRELQANGMEPAEEKEREAREEREDKSAEGEPVRDPSAEIEIPVDKGSPAAGDPEQEKDGGESEAGMKEKITLTMKKYCLDHNLPPHIYDGMKEVFGKIIEDCSKGELTEQAVSLLHHAVSYEESVEEARKEGRIAGRNEAIEEKLRSEAHPDDIPSLGGTATGSENLPRTSIFDLARGAV